MAASRAARGDEPLLSIEPLLSADEPLLSIDEPLLSMDAPLLSIIEAITEARLTQEPPRCFAEPSSGRARDVRLGDVVDLLPLTHNDHTIERYRARMAAGDLFPPIGVLPLFGRLVIADGHKRY